jgi:hypothetical protein
MSLSYLPLIEAKLARRPAGGAGGSSKGRVFRIKAPPPCVAARIAGCIAMASWYPLPPVPAGRREGRLQLRSRRDLEKSAMPSNLIGNTNQ